MVCEAAEAGPSVATILVLVIISDLSKNKCAATGAIVSEGKEKTTFLRRKRSESPEPTQGAKKGEKPVFNHENGVFGEICAPRRAGGAHFKAT